MLAPWQKSYDKPRQYIKKQRGHFAKIGDFDPHFDFHIVKTMAFPLVMYGYKSCTIKKAEH